MIWNNFKLILDPNRFSMSCKIISFSCLNASLKNSNYKPIKILLLVLSVVLVSYLIYVYYFKSDLLADIKQKLDKNIKENNPEYMNANVYNSVKEIGKQHHVTYMNIDH